MFDVQGVSLAYGERTILRNASFKVEDGERAAIIGPNGTGKTTLLRIVAGLLQPESGRVALPKNTEVGYLPQDLELHSEKTVLEECRLVFAELLEHEREMRSLEEKMSHVPHDSPEFENIADRYAFLLHETHRRDMYSMDSTIGRVLDGLGFKPADQDRPCSQFSGGWQMRILLAKILLQNPDVLLLDEPTNHLDIESIQWLGDWLRQHEGSVLMVSHERSFMDALVSKVIEVERGEVAVYRGNYTQSLEKRAERREMQRRTFENQQREIAHKQKFIDRFRYQASKAALVQSRVKQLEKIEKVAPPVEEQGTISFRFPPAPRGSREVLQAEGITKRYGSNTVLENVGFELHRGEKVALVGVNGAGKTTLMRILAGQDPLHQGTVNYGANIGHAYFAQYDRDDLHPDNTVLSEFLSAAPLSVSDRARGILGAFLFTGDDVEKKIAVLSGGERTRLRLAKMLCGNANLLLLDEPTNHLDIGSRLTLEEALRQYEGSCVLVSHDRYFLDNVVTRVVEVGGGRAVSYPGNYSDYLRLKALQEERAAAGNGSTAPERKPSPAQPRTDGPVDAEALAAQLSSVPKKETHAERRARQDREKQQRNRLRKLEKEIAEHEDMLYDYEHAITELENRMADPAAAQDFEKLAKLNAKLEEVHRRKEATETAWLEKQEEAETLESALS